MKKLCVRRVDTEHLISSITTLLSKKTDKRILSCGKMKIAGNRARDSLVELWNHLNY